MMLDDDMHSTRVIDGGVDTYIRIRDKVIDIYAEVITSDRVSHSEESHILNNCNIDIHLLLLFTSIVRDLKNNQ